MASAAQISANRANAEKSTGPCTPEGKAKVAQNAIKHGLLARAAVLQGEDPEEFAEYREQLLEELDANGTLEVLLAERAVSLSWRLQRAARSQNAAFEALYEKHAAGPQTVSAPAKGSTGLEPDEPADSGATLGRMLVEDFAGEKVLERLLMYERRIESSLYRTLAELRRLRREREADEGGTEGISSGKWERSSRHSRASSPPPPTSDFTLGNLLSAIAVLEETLPGATTNAPADSACETKPISHGVGLVPREGSVGQAPPYMVGRVADNTGV